MDYHSTPSSVSKNDRTHISFQGVEYEVDPETGGVLIPLGGKRSKGRFAIVDVTDVSLVTKYRWSGWHGSGLSYAICRPGKDSAEIKMHRLILGVTDPRIHVDHVNHDGLDNRRINIRVATAAQNGWNRSAARGHLRGLTSRYKGVSWDTWSEKWFVTITASKKRRYVGRFADEEAAARAYDNAARELHGEFAYLNFPEEGEES